MRPAERAVEPRGKGVPFEDERVEAGSRRARAATRPAAPAPTIATGTAIS
jgi:hypothetical protein